MSEIQSAPDLEQLSNNVMAEEIKAKENQETAKQAQFRTNEELNAAAAIQKQVEEKITEERRVAADQTVPQRVGGFFRTLGSLIKGS